MPAVSGVAIVGGGLAGAAAAVLLARAGQGVILLERDAEPAHRICGEFISGDAQAMLDRLGLDLQRLGASRIDRVRIISGTRTIGARLPFAAFGLTRKRLDAALLDLAGAAGARVERGVSVRRIDGRRIDSGLGSIDAATLLLASGKHEIRGAPRAIAACDTGYVGFKTYWRLDPGARTALQDHIEIILFEGGYAGLQLVEGGLANLCLLVRKSRLTTLGGTWEAVLAALLAIPHLRDRLAGGEQMLDRPLTIAGVPYGFLHRPAVRDAETLFRLGDQAAVIPSFSGDGMAIALHSAHRAAAIVAAGGTPEAYHRILQADLARQIRLAMRIQTIGETDRWRRLLIGALSFAPALVPQLARATRVRARV